MDATDCPSALPLWVQYVEAFGPVTIGLAVAAVAWMQWQVNRNRLKHELFDRRYVVFEAAREFLRRTIVDGKVNTKARIDFFLSTRESEFILGKEVAVYLDDLNRKAIEAETYRAEYEGEPTGETRKELVRKESAFLRWMLDQPDVLRDRFRPYLKLSSVR